MIMPCPIIMHRPRQCNGAHSDLAKKAECNNNSICRKRSAPIISSASCSPLFLNLLFLATILFAFPAQSLLLDRHLRDINEINKFILNSNLNSSHLLNDPSAFNLTEWYCLLMDADSGGRTVLQELGFYSNDKSNVQSHPPASSYECKCYVSFSCGKSEIIKSATSSSSSSLVNNRIVWLRCYNLSDHDEAYSIIRDFHFEQISTIEKLSKTVQKANKAFHNPIKLCDLDNDSSIKLRTDFIRSSESVSTIFDFVRDLANKLDSSKYQHESLGIINSSLENIPSLVLNSSSVHLKSLNLTQNRLTEFNSTTLFNVTNKLDQLDLSHNQLVRVNLNNLTSLRSISLSDNNLTTLSTTDFPYDFVQLFKTDNDSEFRNLIDEYELNFANNPWNCNSELIWMIDFISRIVEINGQIFEKTKTKMYQSDEPECDLPVTDRMLQFSIWKSMKEMDICDKCRCYLEDKYAKAGYRYVVVNCTDKNLALLPSHLPKNAKIVDLTNNNIRNLNTLPNNEIEIRTELSHWRNVHKIILQNNSLETLEGIERMGSIVYLDVSGNLLTEIPYHLLDTDKDKIDKIGIGNNPYTCDCNTVKMQKWLQTNYRIILDLVNVRCGYLRPELARNGSSVAIQVMDRDDRLIDRQIIHINSLELCPIASLEFFDILNFALSLIIVILLSKVVYDYYWQKRTGKLPRFFRLNI